MTAKNQVSEVNVEYVSRVSEIAVPEGYKQTEVGVIPEDWLISKLESLSTHIIDGTHHTPTYTKHGVPFLRVTDIQGQFNESEFKYVSKAEHEVLIRRCRPEKGDLLLSKNGTIGIPKVVTWDWEFSVFVSLALIKLKKDLMLPEYLYQYFKSSFLHLQLSQRSKQGTVTNLHLEEIRELLVPIPPALEEQTAIANALSDVDALIQAQEQLIAKKQDIKTATMQQLLTGRTRLARFAHHEDGTPKGYKPSELGEIPEDWVVVSFGQLLKIRHGRSQKGVESVNGQYPIFATGGQIGATSEFLYDKPSVLIGRKGTIDKPRYIDTPFWTVDTLFYSEIQKDVDALFMFYKFSLVNWMQYNEASGVPSLNAGTIESILTSIPSIDEQTAIANILSDMDAEIQTLQQRLAKTRLIKQGMMQELLTGKTRLVKPARKPADSN